MSGQDAFERILASLYDAMLDDTRWPATSALIDEACGLTGNALLVGEGPKNDIQILFVGLYYRGHRRTDLEREYLEFYHPINECIPRLRQLPAGHLVHFKDLLTAKELKTSRTYNELFLRGKYQNGLNVLLDGPGGSRMTWGLGDPVASDGWGSSQIVMIKNLLPHIRQFIRVRQTLVRAETRNTTVTALLDEPRLGVLHLDRRGRIIEVNDRARSILRHGDGLSDRDGVLCAREAADRLRLEKLVASALPDSGAVAVSGSMLLGRASGSPAVGGARQTRGRDRQPDYGARPVAALVLIVEPGRRRRIDPGLVARTLGLTPTESRVAVWLAEGKSVRDIAQAAGLSEKHPLLAPAADLREKVHLPAGGPGAVGAVNGRVRVTPAPPASLGGPVAGRFLYLPDPLILLATGRRICGINALPIPEIDTLPAPVPCRNRLWEGHANLPPMSGQDAFEAHHGVVVRRHDGRYPLAGHLGPD